MTVPVISDYESVPKKPVSADNLVGKRILLCEDHPLNREIAVRILMKQGMIVETADNGQIGVDMFKNSIKGYYDAVLMDIRMPVMDGLTAAKEIRASEHPDAAQIPILAMTANAFASDIEASKAAGMNAHLSKPIEPQVLYQELGRYIYSVKTKNNIDGEK